MKGKLHFYDLRWSFFSEMKDKVEELFLML